MRQHEVRTRTNTVTLDGDPRDLFTSRSGKPAYAQQIKIEYERYGERHQVHVSVDAAFSPDAESWDFRETWYGSDLFGTPSWLRAEVLAHKPDWYTQPLPAISGATT